MSNDEPLFDSDVDPKRIKSVADGLRRQGEFESARMLDGYADLLEAQEKAVPVMVVNHVSSAEHDLPIGMKLYTHPAPSDTERLAEALQPFANLLQPHHTSMPDDRPIYGINKAEITAGDLRRANEAITAHSAQAQPPAARVPDAIARRMVAEYDAVLCGDPTATRTDGMRAPLEAALAAQPRVTDVKVRASALLDLLESDFGQSGRDVRVEAIACELCAASLPDASWFSSEVCEARNQWAQRHEMNWLETDENHPDDFIGKWIRDKLLAAQENPNG